MIWKSPPWDFSSSWLGFLTFSSVLSLLPARGLLPHKLVHHGLHWIFPQRTPVAHLLCTRHYAGHLLHTLFHFIPAKPLCNEYYSPTSQTKTRRLREFLYLGNLLYSCVCFAHHTLKIGVNFHTFFARPGSGLLGESWFKSSPSHIAQPLSEVTSSLPCWAWLCSNWVLTSACPRAHPRIQSHDSPWLPEF